MGTKATGGRAEAWGLKKEARDDLQAQGRYLTPRQPPRLRGFKKGVGAVGVRRS